MALHMNSIIIIIIYGSNANKSKFTTSIKLLTWKDNITLWLIENVHTRYARVYTHARDIFISCTFKW